jgi:hypothetical protein
MGFLSFFIIMQEKKHDPTAQPLVEKTMEKTHHA